jgi:hypothetical protein
MAPKLPERLLKICEQAERSVLSKEFEWVTNKGAQDIDEGLPDYLARLERGPPKASDTYSSKQLTEMGMVGLYRKNNPS